MYCYLLLHLEFVQFPVNSVISKIYNAKNYCKTTLYTEQKEQDNILKITSTKRIGRYQKKIILTIKRYTYK